MNGNVVKLMRMVHKYGLTVYLEDEAEEDKCRQAIEDELTRLLAPQAQQPADDNLRDRLIAISAAIADQDDRAAQAMLREILSAPQAQPAPVQEPEMNETQRKEMQNALNSWAADLERGMQVFIPASTLRKIANALEESVQEPVTDEENERFSQDVSNFSGADPEATKYSLEEFLRRRTKSKQVQNTAVWSNPYQEILDASRIGIETANKVKRKLYTAHQSLNTNLIGLKTSVDVSTGDHDAGNRLFGTVTDILDTNPVTLLCDNARPNFNPSRL